MTTQDDVRDRILSVLATIAPKWKRTTFATTCY